MCVGYWSQQFLLLYTAGYVRWILEPTVSTFMYSRLCALDIGANSFQFYTQQTCSAQVAEIAVGNFYNFKNVI
jgi:hypothetical protein